MRKSGEKGIQSPAPDMISHKFLNHNKHFDLEVTTFSRFYFIVCKNGGELPKYEKNYAISEHPNSA